MDILDDMGLSKLSVKVFFKVNYSFKTTSFVLHRRKKEYRFGTAYG